MITRETVLEKIQPVEDPEMGYSLVDLGLIYDVDVSDNNDVSITMTLTSPMCPIGPEIVARVEQAVKDIDRVGRVSVNLVWDPPWNPAEMASDEIKDRLGIW
jgi:metal-sulfur cluster biosynthetic enzyme